MCGEQVEADADWLNESGSAPRVRGTVRAPAPRETTPRFSPACAGNRRRYRPVGRWCAVQPRVCGEQDAPPALAPGGAGSAPRVRGTGQSCRGATRCVRFSPACAGNRHQHSAWARAPAVQPRVCGEQHRRETSHQNGGGSAPRVRGTERHGAQAVGWDRFSPACAGNSKSLNLFNSACTVQPRVCGEQGFGRQPASSVSGSAPRVRGTGTCSLTVVPGERFSPACAGNRLIGLRRISDKTVQPRVCGEQATSKTALPTRCGSAPRVRGTDASSSCRSSQGRFSPACAGNRTARPNGATRSTVQPRVCGEQICRP